MYLIYSKPQYKPEYNFFSLKLQKMEFMTVYL